MRWITAISKGHSAGSDLNDKKEEAASTPQSSQLWFFSTDSLLRRVGGNGGSLGSRPSTDVELTSFILPCVTQVVIHNHLWETLWGVEGLATVNNSIVLDVFKAIPVYGPFESTLSQLERNTQTFNLGIGTHVVYCRPTKTFSPSADQINWRKSTQCTHWVVKHMINTRFESCY